MDIRVVDLRCEHREALGVGARAPRLSWRTETGAPNWVQESYEIELNGDPHGPVRSGDAVLVPWPGEPLQSRQAATVRVRVTGNDGVTSPWSEPLQVEAGLLDATDWVARFVTPVADIGGVSPMPCPYFRTEFVARAGLARARLYVSALGVYEARINGGVVGDQVLAPGWTSYAHRLHYDTFDVTGLVHEGANAIGAVVSEGWYRGRIGFRGGQVDTWGNEFGLLAQLELTYADGTGDVVVTDETWKTTTGSWLAAGLYDGESYDARLDPAGWDTAGFDDAGWAAVRASDRSVATLVARIGPPVRGLEQLAPREVITTPSGRTVIDFGQNLVGFLRIAVRGPAGATVTLRHAEVMQDGELCTAPLRGAAATDRYVLAGTGTVEEWAPRFTTHGFRFAEVDGWPDDAPPLTDSVRAVVCHSDMRRTGWFECSDARITQLHENIVWGMRGNFVDVPTDCPQRDERLGWTGDIAMFSPTACFLFDAGGFLASWLQDLAADQRPDGAVPPVIPSVFEFPPTAAWGDAAVIVPWTVYERTGDETILRTQYESMRAWVDHILGLAGPERLWNTGFQFADWLDPAAPADKPQMGKTDPHLVATAFMAHSTDLLARAAGVLGEDADAAHYGKTFEEVRDAFVGEFVTGSGLMVSDSQTAYALALHFDLITDEGQRRRAGDRLARLVRRAGYRIATGFVGTPFVCDALCAAGHADAAFALLMQEECPSWLYPVLHGATTIWERWDGILPDGRVHPDQMNSFNHYAFGAVGDWLHRRVGGLAPAEPGYRRLRIAPVPGGGLRHATTRHLTPYGEASVAWQVDGDVLRVTAQVPPNTTATVALPGEDAVDVGSGTHEWAAPLRSIES